jgi:hypothetical protein
MNSFEELTFLYERCEHFEGLYDQILDIYVETCRQYFQPIGDYCYICHCQSVDTEHYLFLRSDSCSHCEKDRYLVPPADLCPLTVGVYQSNEVRVEDQQTVSEHVQPNAQKTASNVFVRELCIKPPDVESLFDRQYLIDSNLHWSTIDVIGTSLYRLNLPGDIMLSELPFKGIFDYHGVIRSSFEFEVRLNNNPFVCGALLLQATPTNYCQNTGFTMSNSAEIYPHSYLNAGYETNSKLIVPFVSSHCGIFNQEVVQGRESTQVGVYVWNALKVASGQPVTYTFSAWIKFVDYEIGIKMPKHSNLTHYQAAEHASGLVNLVTKAGEGIANSGVPVISQIAKVIGKVTGFYDSPIMPITTPNNNMVTNVPRMAVDARVSSGDYSTAQTYDPINALKFIQTYGRLYVDSWNTTDAAGTEIIRLSTTYNQYLSTSPNVGGYQVPILEYGRHFNYWSGTIKFKIQVIATRFHQGQLLISWAPFGFANTLTEARSMYYMSIDIGQQNVFEVEVPFVYPVEWALCGVQEHGNIQVWVQNPLVAPSNVSNEVSINIYMGAGEDFRFHVYQDPTLSVYNPQPPPPLVKFQAETSYSGTGKTSVWKPLGEVVSRVSTKANDHVNFDAFLKRPSYVHRLHCQVNPSTKFQKMATLPYIPGDIRDHWPIRPYFASGGTRWSIVTDLPLNARVQFYFRVIYNSLDPTPGFNQVADPVDNEPTDIRSGAHYHHLQCPGERVMTFEIPMYLPAEYLCFERENDFLVPFPTIQFLVQSEEDSIGFGVHYYWTAADDFRTHWPLSGPVRPIRTFTQSNNYTRDSDKKLPLAKLQCKEKYLTGFEINNDNDFKLGEFEAFEFELEEKIRKTREQLEEELGELPKCKLRGKRRSMRAAVRRLLRVNNRIVNWQGPVDFVMGTGKELLAWLQSVGNGVTQMYQGIRDSIYTAYTVGCSIKDKVAWLDAMQVMLNFLSDQILPIYFAIELAWSTTGPKQWIAMSWLAAKAFSAFCPNKQTEGHVMQGPEDLEPLSEIVTSGCRTIIRTFLYTLGFDASVDYDQYLNRILFGKTVDSWEYVALTFTHTVLYLLYGKTLNAEWERNAITPVLNVVTKFNDDFAQGLFSGIEIYASRGDKTNAQILDEYYDVVKKITERGMDIRFPATISAAVERLKSTRNEIKRMERIKTDQPEPTGILLVGNPGSGKSYVTSLVMPRILEYMKAIPYHKTPLFNMPKTEQDSYWNNYNGQSIIVCDDAFSERDGKDPIKFINLITSARMPIPMAELSQKGTQFEGRVICASSNLKDFGVINTLNNRDALYRRFPFTYRVVAKPDYLKSDVCGLKTFNATKFVNDLPDFTGPLTAEQAKEYLRVCDEAWEFHTTSMDPLRASYTYADSLKPAVHTFSHFMELLSDRLKTFLATYNRMNGLTGGFKLQGPSDESDDSGEEDYSDTSSISTNTELRENIDLFENYLSQQNPYTIEQTLELQYLDWVEDEEIPKSTYHGKLVEATCTMYGIRKPFRENLSGRALEIYNLIVPVERKAKVTWKGVLGVLAGVGIAGAAIYAIFRSIGCVWKKLIPTFLQSYTGENIIGHLKAIKPHKPVVTAVGGTFQADQKVDIHRAIHKNLIKLELNREDGLANMAVNALLLNDRAILCNQHLVDKFFIYAKESTAILHFHRNGEIVPLRLTKSNCRNVPSNGLPSDLCIIVSGTPLPGARNILQFVADDNCLNLDGRDQEAFIMGVGGREDILCTLMRYTTIGNVTGVFLQATPEELTISGDCGRPYILRGANFAKPLVGIHACLIGDTVGAVPLNATEIRQVLKSMATVQHIEPEKVQVQATETTSRYWDSTIPLEEKYVVNGVSMKHATPVETSLKPLTLNGRLVKHPEWKCDMIPAALKPRDGKHPLISNSQKYEVGGRYAMDPIIHKTVADHFVAKFVDKPIPSVYDIDIAINGNGTMNALQFKTGSGYWIDHGFKNGKTEFFIALDQEIDPITGQALPLKYTFSAKARDYIVPIWSTSFCQRLSDCEEMAKSATKFQTFWVSTNKDELRPLQKVIDVKTRVFEQPGLEFTLLVRRYFGAFLDYYKTRSGFTFYHGIGADKEVAWKHYWDGLSRHSHQGHAFDYKNFDGSVNADAFQFFEDVIKRFYHNGSDEEHNVRSVLIRILRDGDHIMGPYHFRSAQGNKSGNPFTDVFNSVCNYYIMSTAYVIGRQVKGRSISMAHFDRDVKMLTYGDDIIMAVTPPALEYFNGPLIKEIVTLFGYNITDALKTGIIPYSCHVTDLTFLKSSFMQDREAILAPMPKQDIYKELCYAPKQCIGDHLDLQQRIANVLRFMAHHGEDALEQFKGELRERGIKREWLSLSYDTFYTEIVEKQSCIAAY